MAGQFDCGDGLGCLASERRCDNQTDCSNGRDEQDTLCTPELYSRQSSTSYLPYIITGSSVVALIVLFMAIYVTKKYYCDYYCISYN